MNRVLGDEVAHLRVQEISIGQRHLTQPVLSVGSLLANITPAIVVGIIVPGHIGLGHRLDVREPSPVGQFLRVY